MGVEVPNNPFCELKMSVCRAIAKLLVSVHLAAFAADLKSHSSFSVLTERLQTTSCCCGPWTVDRGPWTVDRGPWTVDHGATEHESTA